MLTGIAGSFRFDDGLRQVEQTRERRLSSPRAWARHLGHLVEREDVASSGDAGERNALPSVQEHGRLAIQARLIQIKLV